MAPPRRRRSAAQGIIVPPAEAAGRAAADRALNLSAASRKRCSGLFRPRWILLAFARYACVVRLWNVRLRGRGSSAQRPRPPTRRVNPERDRLSVRYRALLQERAR